MENIKFEINKKKKKEIQKELQSKNKLAGEFNIAAKAILFGSVIFSAVLLMLIAIIPDWYSVTIRGVVQKDTTMITITVSSIISCGLVIWLLLKTVAWRFAAIESSERVDEELEIKDGILTYVFRKEYEMEPDKRIVYIIPLKDIQHVLFDGNLQKISILAEINVINYLDYFDLNISSTQTVGSVEVYNYFTPDLLKILSEYKQVEEE